MYERAFVTGEFGYASAIGLLLFAFALFLLFVINRLLRPYRGNQSLADPVL